MESWPERQDDIIDYLQTSNHENYDFRKVKHGVDMVDYSIIHHSPVKFICPILGNSKQWYILTQIDGGQFYMWKCDVTKDEATLTKIKGRTIIDIMVFIPNLNIFGGYCGDSTIKLFRNVSAGFPKAMSIRLGFHVTTMSYEVDRCWLIVGGKSGNLVKFVLDTEDGFKRFSKIRITCSINEDIIHLNFEKHFLLATTSSSVHLYNLNKEFEAKAIREEKVKFTSAAACQDWDVIIIGDSKGVIRFQKWSTGEELLRMEKHKNRICDLKLIPNEPMIIAGGEDSKISFWRLDQLGCENEIIWAEAVQRIEIVTPDKLMVAGENFVQFAQFTPLHKTLTKSKLLEKIEAISLSTYPNTDDQIIVRVENGVQVVSVQSGELLTSAESKITPFSPRSEAMNRETDRLFIADINGLVVQFNTKVNPSDPLDKMLPDDAQPGQEVTAMATVVKVSPEISGPNTIHTVILGAHKSGRITLLEAQKEFMDEDLYGHDAGVEQLRAISSQNRQEIRLISRTEIEAKIWDLKFIPATLGRQEIELVELRTIVCPQRIVDFHLCSETLVIAYNDELDLCDIVGEEKRQIVDITHGTNSIKMIDSSPTLNVVMALVGAKHIVILNPMGESLSTIDLARPTNTISFIRPWGDLAFNDDGFLSTIPVHKYLPLKSLHEILIKEFPEDSNFDVELERSEYANLGINFDDLPAYPIDIQERRRKKLEELIEMEDHIDHYELTEGEHDKKILSITLKTTPINETFRELVHNMAAALDCDVKWISQDGKLIDLAGRVTQTDTHTGPLMYGYSERGLEAFVANFDPKNILEWPVAPDGHLPNSIVRSLIKDKAIALRERKQEAQRAKEVADRFKRRLKDLLASQEDKLATRKKHIDKLQRVKRKRNDNGHDFEFGFEKDLRQKAEKEAREKAEKDAREKEKEKKGERITKKKDASLKKKSNKREFEPYDPDKHLNPPSKTIAEVVRLLIEQRKRNNDNLEDSTEEDNNLDLSGVSPIIEQIISEHWFPKHKGESFAQVMETLAELLGEVRSSIHEKICNYIVLVDEDEGIQRDLRQLLVNQLLKQLDHPLQAIQENSLRTILKLGAKAPTGMTLLETKKSLKRVKKLIREFDLDTPDTEEVLETMIRPEVSESPAKPGEYSFDSTSDDEQQGKEEEFEKLRRSKSADVIYLRNPEEDKEIPPEPDNNVPDIPKRSKSASDLHQDDERIRPESRETESDFEVPTLPRPRSTQLETDTGEEDQGIEKSRPRSVNLEEYRSKCLADLNTPQRYKALFETQDSMSLSSLSKFRRHSETYSEGGESKGTDSGFGSMLSESFGSSGILKNKRNHDASLLPAIISAENSFIADYENGKDAEWGKSNPVIGVATTSAKLTAKEIFGPQNTVSKSFHERFHRFLHQGEPLLADEVRRSSSKVKLEPIKVPRKKRPELLPAVSVVKFGEIGGIGIRGQRRLPSLAIRRVSSQDGKEIKYRRRTSFDLKRLRSPQKRFFDNDFRVPVIQLWK